MEIADEVAHQALGYVAAVSRRGHRLTLDEFKAYIGSPGRTATSQGGLSSLITAQQVIRSFAGTVKVEPVIDWLTRLMWLESDGKYVQITSLGEIVLASLEDRASEPEGPLVTILESQDALAYPTVIGNIGKRGEALLIDPYFRLDALPHVLQFTDVRRLLIGPKAEVSALGTALTTTITPNRPFEVRVSKEPHDRLVIPKSGPVDALGTSLSGVGRKFSVMFEIRQPEADGVRQAANEMWDKAQPLMAAGTPASSQSIPVGKTKPKTPRRRTATPKTP